MFQKLPKEEFTLEGNRIVDIFFLIEQLICIGSHGSVFGCNLSNLKFCSEKTSGLHSKFSITCGMCNEKFFLETTRRSNHNADINYEAVSGIMSLGLGFTHLKMFLACLNIPSITLRLYTSIHDTVCSRWQRAAEQSMAQAAREESEHAKSIGSVDVDGVPMITVVADGCWSKRSYGTNYNALSGAAAIIGQFTKKVL